MEQIAGIGDRLQQVRKLLDWTQDELANRSGVGVATIRRCETSIFEPRLSTAQRLANTMGIRTGWLLTGDGAIWQGSGQESESHRV